MWGMSKVTGEYVVTNVIIGFMPDVLMCLMVTTEGYLIVLKVGYALVVQTSIDTPRK